MTSIYHIRNKNTIPLSINLERSKAAAEEDLEHTFSHKHIKSIPMNKTISPEEELTD